MDGVEEADEGGDGGEGLEEEEDYRPDFGRREYRPRDPRYCHRCSRWLVLKLVSTAWNSW
jgi:hypothetical protein